MWESPETLVIPYENAFDVHHDGGMHGFKDVVMAFCDKCRWCCSCFEQRCILECPQCNAVVSQIPIASDEVSRIEYDDGQGVTLWFDRKVLVEMEQASSGNRHLVQ